MKIQPVASPFAIKDTSTPESVRTAKAVAAFNKGQSSYDKPTITQTAQHSVDQNNISPEELSAVKAPTPVDAPTPVEATQEQTPPAPQEEAKETVKDPALVRQYNLLARQERALRQKAQAQAQELQKQQEAFKTEKAAFEARIQEMEKGYVSRDRIKADPLGTYEEAGVTYDDVTQQAITRQPTDPRVMSTIQRLEAKIAELESSNQKAAKTYQDQQQAAYQSAVKQIRADAVALVKSNPEEFEAIAKTGSVKDVVELITRTYDKDGVLLSVEEAAQQVEDYLVEEGEKLTRIEKIKKRIAGSNASTPGSNQKTQAQTQTQPTPMKTLTNATASTRKLSARERALLAFKGELKS